MMRILYPETSTLPTVVFHFSFVDRWSPQKLAQTYPSLEMPHYCPLPDDTSHFDIGI